MKKKITEGFIVDTADSCRETLASDSRPNPKIDEIFEKVFHQYREAFDKLAKL